jgi:S1-C subfamily serine protease
MLDLVLIVMLLLAAVGGFRLGLLARAASWAGLALGIVVSTWTVPAVLSVVSDGSALTRLLLGLFVLTLTVGLGSSIGGAIGLRMRRAVSATGLGPIDRGLGLVAGVVGVVVVVWLLLPAAAEVPGSVSRQVRSSSVIALIRDATPTPPDAISALRGLVDGSRFPEVFEDLRPAPDTGPPPDQIPVSRRVLRAVTASTVNVESEGCGTRYEGSGWAVARNTIVTNAHVVAGADTVVVRRPDGEVIDAEVVVFDDDRDLAVLEVAGLGQRPLQMASPDEGSEGVVVGYPGGQDTPRPQPVVVRRQEAVVGRDIYGRDQTRREVLFLAARLQQGDSGSPVANTDGHIVGTVFAISPDRPTTAYALAIEEVEAVLDAPREPGRTGRCT